MPNFFCGSLVVVRCGPQGVSALFDRPGARTAAEVTRNGRIGVIATEATIGSQMYNKYIQELNKDVTIYGKACPLFVPLVEEGLWEDPVTDEIAKRYLSELIDIDIDTLILGCTH